MEIENVHNSQDFDLLRYFWFSDFYSMTCVQHFLTYFSFLMFIIFQQRDGHSWGSSTPRIWFVNVKVTVIPYQSSSSKKKLNLAQFSFWRKFEWKNNPIAVIRILSSPVINQLTWWKFSFPFGWLFLILSMR